MRKIIQIVLGMTVAVSLLYIVGCMYIYSQPPTIWCPEEGVWLCEELQMQMDFENGDGTYAIIDGQKIKCGIENDRGSTHVSVICQEWYHDKYKAGHVFFAGFYQDLTDSQFFLKEAKSDKVYVFNRIA